MRFYLENNVTFIKIFKKKIFETQISERKNNETLKCSHVPRGCINQCAPTQRGDNNWDVGE